LNVATVRFVIAGVTRTMLMDNVVTLNDAEVVVDVVVVVALVVGGVVVVEVVDFFGVVVVVVDVFVVVDLVVAVVAVDFAVTVVDRFVVVGRTRHMEALSRLSAAWGLRKTSGWGERVKIAPD
jgi:hypothetical protein